MNKHTKHKRVSYVDQNGELCEAFIPIEAYEAVVNRVKHRRVTLSFSKPNLPQEFVLNATILIMMIAILATIVMISG